MKPLNLPATYVPFAKLQIGDTLVNNAQTLVTVGGLVPLLIGDGPVLSVWLSLPFDFWNDKSRLKSDH